MTQKAKVLLVDDHPLVREWLANLINQQSDLEVCGEADSAPKALQMIGVVNPDGRHRGHFDGGRLGH